MTTRSRMVHRALIEVNTQAVGDGYGQSRPPVWAAKYLKMPCYLWTKSRMERVNENTTQITEEVSLIFPLSYVVTERDRIRSITNRLGFSIAAGPYNVRAIQRDADHFLATLQEVS